MKKVNVQIYEGSPLEVKSKDNNNWFITSAEYNDDGKITSINSMVDSEGKSITPESVPLLPVSIPQGYVDWTYEGGNLLYCNYEYDMASLSPALLMDPMPISGPLYKKKGDRVLVTNATGEGDDFYIKFLKDYVIDSASLSDILTYSTITGMIYSIVVDNSYWEIDE